MVLALATVERVNSGDDKARDALVEIPKSA